MRLFGGLFALLLAALALPAHAQVMELDFEDLRKVVGELDFTLHDEGVDEDGDYYFEVESDTGLLFNLYGNSCDEGEPMEGCLGLNMVATFPIGDGHDPDEVMDSISYAFMKTYRSGEDIKISRYLIFDGGISRENMVANISIFAEIGDLIWEQLTDDGVLKD